MPKVFLYILMFCALHSFAQTPDLKYLPEKPPPELILPPDYYPMHATSAVMAMPGCGMWSVMQEEMLISYTVFRKDGKYGMKKFQDPDIMHLTNDTIPLNEKLMIPYEYDTLFQIDGIDVVRFMGRKNGKWGVVDMNNQIIWDFEYDSLIFLSSGHQYACIHQNGLLLAHKDGKVGTLHASGKIQVPLEYDEVEHDYGTYDCPHHRKMIQVKNNGLVGMVSDSGTVIVGALYEDVRYMTGYEENLIFVAKKDGKCGLLDYQGNEILPFKYQNVSTSPIWGDVSKYSVKVNGKWGTITEDGTYVMKPKYDSLDVIYDWRRPKAAFKKYGKWGVCDSAGRVLIPAKFDEIQIENNGVYSYRLKHGWGFLGPTGKLWTHPKYSSIEETEEHLALVKRNGKWGIFNMRTGREMIPPKYGAPINYDNGDYLHWTNYLYGDNWMCWSKNDKYGILDSSGRTRVNFLYDWPIDRQIGDGCFEGYRNEKVYLVVMDRGEVAGPADNFWSAYWTISGMILGEKDSLYALYSLKGKKLTGFEYNMIEPFENPYSNSRYSEYLSIVKSGKQGVMDTLGRVIVPAKYDNIELTQEGNFEVQKGLELGLFNSKGKLIEPFGYPVVDTLSNKATLVKIGGRVGILDSNGVWSDSTYYEDVFKTKGGYYETKVKVVTNWRSKGATEPRYGLLDSNLNVIFEPKYKSIRLTNNSFGKLQHKDNWYSLFDLDRNWVDTNSYYKIEPMESGYFYAMRGYRKGIIDSAGVQIMKPRYSKIKYFDGETAGVKRDGKYALWDVERGETTPFIYEKVKYKHGDYFGVRVNEKFGVVNIDGDTIIPFELSEKIDFPTLFVRGIVSVRKGGYYGLIDSSFNMIVPPTYQKEITKFEVLDDFRYILISDKDYNYTVYTREGKKLFPNKPRKISDKILATTGLFVLSANGATALANTSGKMIMEYQLFSIVEGIGSFDEFYSLENKQPYILIKQKGKYGLIDLNGNILLKPFAESWKAKDGVIYFRKGKKWIYLDKDLNKQKTSSIN